MLTDLESVKKLIAMLETVLKQMRKCGKHTIVADITYDSLEWVINSAINELNHLMSIM